MTQVRRPVLATLSAFGASLPTAVKDMRGHLYWKRANGAEDEIYAGVKDASSVNQLRRILTKTYGDTLYSATAHTHAEALTMTMGPYFLTNVGFSTEVALNIGYYTDTTAVGHDADIPPMPRAGKIVGLMLGVKTAPNGTGIGKVSVAGSISAWDSGAVVLDNTHQGDSSVVAYANGVSFAAGDVIAPAISTDINWNSAVDLTGWLIVTFTAF